MEWIQKSAGGAEVMGCLRKNCCRMKRDVFICIVRVGDKKPCLQFSVCGGYFSTNSISSEIK